MKKICALVLALVLCFCLSATAFADVIVTEPVVENLEETGVEPRAEEVGWKYRVYNGNLEKRLWSYTYGKWLTDWIYVGPDPTL